MYDIDPEVLKEAVRLTIQKTAAAGMPPPPPQAQQQQQQQQQNSVGFNNVVAVIEETNTKKKYERIKCPLLTKMPQKFHKRCSKCMYIQGLKEATVFENGMVYITTPYCYKCYWYNSKLAEKYFDEERGKEMREMLEEDYYGLSD